MMQLIYDEAQQINVTPTGEAVVDTEAGLLYSLCQGDSDSEPRQDD